jgi:hypothetical protein
MNFGSNDRRGDTSFVVAVSVAAVFLLIIFGLLWSYTAPRGGPEGGTDPMISKSQPTARPETTQTPPPTEQPK